MDDNSTIRIRRRPEGVRNPYFRMLRQTAQNETLSWEARGVLAYLLSMPDDYQLQIDDLRQGCGREKAYRILNELIDAGHIERSWERDKDNKRFQSSSYTIYEGIDRS